MAIRSHTYACTYYQPSSRDYEPQKMDSCFAYIGSRDCSIMFQFPLISDSSLIPHPICKEDLVTNSWPAQDPHIARKMESLVISLSCAIETHILFLYLINLGCSYDIHNHLCSTYRGMWFELSDRTLTAQALGLNLVNCKLLHFPLFCLVTTKALAIINHIGLQQVVEQAPKNLWLRPFTLTSCSNY